MPATNNKTLQRTSLPVFSVFEHDVLRVGEQWGNTTFTEHHLESLVALSVRLKHKYFSLGHRSVRFKNYVGILATSQLTIEILPKVDRQTGKRQASWQGILVDLLRACRFVRPESTGLAFLGAKPGDLLEWYLQVFIDELKALLRHGLLHQYRNREADLGVLKGRLNVSHQVRKNLFHRERFHVAYDEFSERHPANVMIGAALQKLQFLLLGTELQTQIRYLAKCFPQPVAGEILPLLLPEDLQKDRRLMRYNQALSIARHILQDEHPDVQAGPYRGLALLFDMNLLFEEYLYRQLLHWKGNKIQIERQQSTIFWGHNRLRPDLVIASPQDRWVLDTKWRVLPNLQPTADELRQIYVYCDYFKARRGVLIFPHTGEKPLTYQEQFSPLPIPYRQDRSCQLYFARVLTQEGRLNRELGSEVLEAIGVR